MDVGFIIFTLAMPALAIAAFVGYRMVTNRRQSVSRWPETLGRIVFASVDEREDANGVKAYYPNVTFEYEVGGKRYQGNKLTLKDAGYATADEARSRISFYTIGKRLEVYYDPKNPRIAVLER